MLLFGLQLCLIALSAHVGPLKSQNPPEKLKLGLTTLGSRQAIWSISDTNKATITVPPEADAFDTTIAELKRLKTFLKVYKSNAEVYKNVRQKKTFEEYVANLLPLVEQFNNSLSAWPTVSTAASVPLPESECQITLQPPDFAEDLRLATQDLYLGQRYDEIVTKKSTDTTTNNEETTQGPIKLNVVLRRLNVNNVHALISNHLETLTELLAGIEQLFNNELPSNIINLLQSQDNCIDITKHELIDLESCSYTSLGYSCTLHLSALQQLDIGFKLIPIPFIPLGEGSTALHLDYMPGTFINQDETKILDRSACALRQEKLICDSQAWTVDPCLTAINSLKGENIVKNCKFTKIYQQAKPIIKTTQWGVLIAPRNSDTIKAKWDVKGGKVQVINLDICKPHILTGQGSVVLTIGVGVFQHKIKETKLNPIDGEACILVPKINGSLLNLDLSEDIAFPELQFLQSNFYEIAQSIVTLVSLIVSLAGLPYCFRFCRERCSRNNNHSCDIQNNERQSRATAPNDPQVGGPSLQNLREERSALLGDITNAAMQTLAAARNK